MDAGMPADNRYRFDLMRALVMLFLLVLISGCSAGNYAPVVELYGQPAKPARKVTSGTHVVKQGETLYSIAWRYGWDYRELARANRIPAPYTIYPGQRISMALKPSSSSSTASTNTASAQTNSKPSSKPSAKPQASTSKPPSNNKAPSQPSSTASSALAWHWPASGEVVEKFSAAGNGRKGIAISGQRHSPVVAAAPGRVVYRGSGLTGYGNLIIIKHSERWLSAYAHNDKMLVTEGASVKAGQKIATMGATGTFRTQLHFEIRKDGKPVDPLLYLPKS